VRGECIDDGATTTDGGACRDNRAYFHAAAEGAGDKSVEAAHLAAA